MQVTNTFSYEPNFNQLVSVTDPLNHSTTFSYDRNGNLSTVTDALTHAASFAYNGTGQVTLITDALNNTLQLGYIGGDLVSVVDPLGNSSSSIFDGALGRRTKNLQNKSFLFDGSNAAQELSGGTVLANLLNGGIDEVFSRTDSSASFTPLKDGLGSTIALVDGSGNIATTYTYDPFGNTTSSGTANSNVFQYTGRENEGNGLYFYRDRYFNSVLGRFINEDPLGFAGSGLNFYAYVFNNPTNLVDPFGLDAGTLALGGRILGGTEIGADVIGGAVTVGEAAPAVGAAGLAGWGIGRGVGHVPLIGGGTVDDGWQDIFTYLSFRKPW